MFSFCLKGARWGGLHWDVSKTSRGAPQAAGATTGPATAAAAPNSAPSPEPGPTALGPTAFPGPAPVPCCFPECTWPAEGGCASPGTGEEEERGGELQLVTSLIHTLAFITILNNGFSIFLKFNLFLWWKADFFCNITPVFSVTWCFRNLSNTMICSRNISYQCWQQLWCLIFLWKLIGFLE